MCLQGACFGAQLSARTGVLQFPTPAAVASQQQNPDKPQGVLLLGGSDTFMRVLFNRPNEDGGVA